MKYLFFLIALISFGASSHCYISNGLKPMCLAMN